MKFIHVFCLVAMATSLVACASGKELEAPCGPLTSYVESEDACGPLKPLNVSPFDEIMEPSK